MKLILVLLLIFCFALAGCTSGTAPNNTASGTSSSATPASNNTVNTSNTPPKPPTLDEEGMKIGRKYFEDDMVQCGDSYYTMTENDNLPQDEAVSLRNYIQYRGVDFSLNIDPVSELNRMNGLEWSGNVMMNWTFVRTSYGFVKPRRWASWQAKGSNIIFVRKNKAGWKLESGPSTETRKKPSCQEVEQIPEGQ